MDSNRQTIVYPARLVRTMDPARPTAEAVAVRGDRIRAVGTVKELMAYPGTVLDERYHDAVLLPGFVEAHSHAGSGAMWENTYVGLVDRMAPDGTSWAGCRSVDDIQTRLREAHAAMEDPDRPLLAWGLDPIYFPGQSVGAAELDRASSRRPIAVYHASGHMMSVNTAALRLCGIDAGTSMEGVVKDARGNPTGVLQEFSAMALAGPVSGHGGGPGLSRASIEKFAQDAVNCGVTTATDLGTGALMTEEGAGSYRDVVTDGFPLRLSVFHFGAGAGPSAGFAEAAERLVALRAESTDHLRFGHVKLMLDGSIQGFTARLLEPGYLGDQPNGIWGTTPEQFKHAFATFHRAGLLVHAHCNGDQTTKLFLDTLEAILTEFPRPDHRHTITHSQMSTPAQYRRMAALGVCANIFSNHIWAWGDQHIDITVGPDRAARMNAAATALRCGVAISLHSDCPVTPLGPLHTAKHAVTRLTMSGRVMGEYERITMDQALQAITLGGAYMLKMDHEVGSLEAGKFADLAVLAEDPLGVEPGEVPAIRVIGTMVGGEHFASAVGSALGSRP